MSPDDKTLIALGLIVKPRGLSGEVVVRPYNEFNPSLRIDLPVVISAERVFHHFKIEYVKRHGDCVWVKFKGIDNRDQAEELRNSEVLSEFKNLPEKKSDEFYIFDIVGLDVLDADNKIFGKIKDILNLPANDALVVEYDEGEVLVPFVKEMIDSIDMDSKQIKISKIGDFLL